LPGPRDIDLPWCNTNRQLQSLILSAKEFYFSCFFHAEFKLKRVNVYRVAWPRV
jgi:hypothetical protein